MKLGKGGGGGALNQVISSSPQIRAASQQRRAVGGGAFAGPTVPWNGHLEADFGCFKGESSKS